MLTERQPEKGEGSVSVRRRAARPRRSRKRARVIRRNAPCAYKGKCTGFNPCAASRRVSDQCRLHRRPGLREQHLRADSHRDCAGRACWQRLREGTTAPPHLRGQRCQPPVHMSARGRARQSVQPRVTSAPRDFVARPVRRVRSAENPQSCNPGSGVGGQPGAPVMEEGTYRCPLRLGRLLSAASWAASHAHERQTA